MITQTYDTFFYVTSMLRVYAAATVILILFPLYMWRYYLRDKQYRQRFLFCLITQNCYLINLVLVLGILEICNVYTVLLGLALEFVLVRWKCPGKKRASVPRSGARAARVPRTFRALLEALLRSASGALKRARKAPIWRKLCAHWFVYLVMGAAIAYNIYFLTYNVNTLHSYQFSDIPVHQAWVYALEHGELFVSGVYPFGMHAVVYVIRVLTGINLREILLYFGSFQTIMLLICIYCVSRRLFKGQYIALVPVVLFSLLLNNGRYVASLPQECGMFAFMTILYYMIEILQSKRLPRVVKGDSRARRFFRINQYYFKRYLTIDVLLLMLSVSLVIAYHFYTAIAAFVLVFALALAYLPRVLKKQYWVPLVVAGVMGGVIAVAPMGVCLLKGIPFQESMAWATSVIRGEEYISVDTGYQERMEQVKEGTLSLEDLPENERGAKARDPSEQPEQKEPFNPVQFAKKAYQAVLNFSKGQLYAEEAGYLALGCLALALISLIVCLPFRSVRWFACGYVAAGLYVIFVAILGQASEMGLPSIIAEGRANVFVQPVLFILYAVPLDILYRLLDRRSGKVYQAALSVVSVAMCCACVWAIFRVDWVHKRFDANIAYYNEPEYALRHIKQEFPKHSYIVVSPTEEYYEVLDYAYHTEISEFIDMVDGGQELFTFPSRYVFFFIEKQALQDYYHGFYTPIEPKYALDKFVYMKSNQDYYYQRVILESKAYYWAQACRRMYPSAFTTYFENDIYVVYRLEQNVNYPYNLRLDYQTELKKLAAETEEGT